MWFSKAPFNLEDTANMNRSGMADHTHSSLPTVDRMLEVTESCKQKRLLVVEQVSRGETPTAAQNHLSVVMTMEVTTMDPTIEVVLQVEKEGVAMETDTIVPIVVLVVATTTSQALVIGAKHLQWITDMVVHRLPPDTKTIWRSKLSPVSLPDFVVQKKLGWPSKMDKLRTRIACVVGRT